MLAIENFVCECFGTGVPEKVANLIRLIYNAIRIGVPIILIIVGMFDMGKAVTLHDENEIKKAQTLLVRKAVAAALVFLILSLVTLLISIVDENHEEDLGCVSCILSSSRDSSKVSKDTFERVESISFSEKEISLNLGKTKHITLNIKPENATDKTITFDSTNKDIVDFQIYERKNSYFIKITAKKEGTVKYKAISNSDNTLSDEVIITVSNNPLLTSKTDIFLTLNQEETIYAYDKFSKQNVSWVSVDPNIATVNSSGKITAKKIGTTKVVASDLQREAQVTVHVLDIDVSSIAKTIKINNQSKLQAKILGDDTGVSIKWSIVSGAERLSIDETGNIKGVKVGVAKVKATIYTGSGATNISKTFNITVNATETKKFVHYVHLKAGETLKINYPNSITITNKTIITINNRSYSLKIDSSNNNIANVTFSKNSAQITAFNNTGEETITLTVDNYIINNTYYEIIQILKIYVYKENNVCIPNDNNKILTDFKVDDLTMIPIYDLTFNQNYLIGDKILISGGGGITGEASRSFEMTFKKINNDSTCRNYVIAAQFGNKNTGINFMIRQRVFYSSGIMQANSPYIRCQIYINWSWDLSHNRNECGTSNVDLLHYSIYYTK